jgi:hypothetical protein
MIKRDDRSALKALLLCFVATICFPAPRRAQTGEVASDQRGLILKNDSGDWAAFSQIVGSNHERIGQLLGAPNSTLYFSKDGKGIEHGEAKFVADDGSSEVIACHVSNAIVDFVALNVTELWWRAFGDTKEMKLLKQSVTYHLASNKTDELVEQELLRGVAIISKSDNIILNELRGTAKRGPNARISFNVKDGNRAIPTTVGLVMEFNGCVGAAAIPPALTTGSPAATKTPSKKVP